MASYSPKPIHVLPNNVISAKISSVVSYVSIICHLKYC